MPARPVCNICCASFSRVSRGRPSKFPVAPCSSIYTNRNSARRYPYGLELDQRCVALSAFALALAARRWPEAGGYRRLPELNLACSGLAPNATKEEWSALPEQAPADDTRLSAQLRGTMDTLYDLFRQAPILGSLIDPRALGASAADPAGLR